MRNKTYVAFIVVLTLLLSSPPVTLATAVSTPSSITKLSLSPSLKTVLDKSVVKMKLTVTPKNASTASASWKTSKPTIATVVDGVVTALKPGTVIISATVGTKRATAKIIIKPRKATKITLAKSASKLSAGKKLTLTAEVEPATATNRTVSWSSSDTKLATVDSSGVVTAKRVGTVTIRATTRDGSKLSASRKLTVTEALPDSAMESPVYGPLLAILKNNIGMAELTNTSTYVEADISHTRWYNSKGLLSGQLIDLDGDKEDELVLLYITDGGASGRRLWMRVYTAPSGTPAQIADIMLDEQFATDSVTIDLYSIKNGDTTYLFYQRLETFDSAWGGYFVFAMKNGKVGVVKGLRDGIWTDFVRLDKMSPLTLVSSLATSYYVKTAATTLLYEEDLTGKKSGKYPSYRTAVLTELAPYGITAFDSQKYCPHTVKTPAMNRICAIYYTRDDDARMNTALMRDLTNLRGL